MKTIKIKIKLCFYRTAKYLYIKLKQANIYIDYQTVNNNKMFDNIISLNERLEIEKERNLNSRMKRRNRAYRKSKAWYYYGKN